MSSLPAGYRQYLDRLSQGPVALAEPDDPRAQKALGQMLELLCTPEEAALLSKLPLRPAPIGEVARRVGLPASELELRIDRLADRGLVLDLVSRRTGEKKYLLSPPVVGFIEFSLMRVTGPIPKKEMSKALHRYLARDPAFGREVFDTATVIGRALAHEEVPGGPGAGGPGTDGPGPDGDGPDASADPLGPSVPGEADDLPEVLDWERLSELVAGADRLAVSHCYCRHMSLHLGRECAVPMEMCVSLNGGADYVIRHGFGREIERTEARDIFTAAREYGLVHIADNVQQRPAYICNCCACCCHQLGYSRNAEVPGVVPSGFYAGTDDGLCSGCARCARACPVGAITMQPAKMARPRDGAGDGPRRMELLPQVDTARCLGCGVCALTCRRDAMQMHRRWELPRVPLNSVEYAVRRALERGRLADLLADTAAGPGRKVLNRTLRAVLSLPPAERVLAAEQVQSRFVSFVLDQQGGGHVPKD